MDTSIWVPVVVALVVGAATVLATRHWGNRRRRLLFRYESAPLLPADSREGLLAVTFRDVPVPNPHLMSFSLQNIGPSDVATEHFDSGTPVRVVLSSRIFGLTASSHPSVTRWPAIGADGWVELAPTLLRRGDEWSVQVVVEGEGDPQLLSSLIDTDVVDGPSTREQLADLLLSGLVLTGPFGMSIRIPRSIR